jgi:hypothetical protein
MLITYLEIYHLVSQKTMENEKNSESIGQGDRIKIDPTQPNNASKNAKCC